jgi:hypothetical protein
MTTWISSSYWTELRCQLLVLDALSPPEKWFLVTKETGWSPEKVAAKRNRTLTVYIVAGHFTDWVSISVSLLWTPLYRLSCHKCWLAVDLKFFCLQCTSHCHFIRGDQKISMRLMITIQNVKSDVQSFPRQSPDIYWHYTHTNAICYP